MIMNDMREDGFLEKLAGLKEKGIMNGGCVSEADIDDFFPELGGPQRDALKTYLKDNNIGIGEALPDEEILTGEESLSYKLYMEELDEGHKIGEDMKRVLIMNALNGDNNARDELIRAYLKDVADMAKLYAGQGVDINDLIGEGNVALTVAIGMLESIEDPSDCDEMVVRSVMNAMEAMVGSENAETEMLRNAFAKVAKIADKAKELSEEYRRKVSVAELAGEGMDEEEIMEVLRLSKGLTEYIAV